MLTQNPPIDRLKYIQKLYGEKQPWVVLDTLSVIFDTIGIDEPWREVDKMPSSQEIGYLVSEDGFYPGLPDPRLNRGDYRGAISHSWNMDPTKHQPRLDRSLNLLLRAVNNPVFADGAMSNPQDADGVFPWVARELSKLSKHVISAIEEKRKAGLDPAGDYDDYTAALNRLRKSTNLIAQWSKATRTDLMKLSLAEVLEKSKGLRVKKKVEHGEIVYKFKNGWTVESLSGKRQLDCETGFLSHCVYTYKDAIESGRSVIYSLRDPDGVPYVTMEWQPGRQRFDQVFGKTNSNIGDSVFNEYVLAAGQDNDPPLQPDQVPVVVEAIRSMVAEFIDQKHGGEINGLLLARASLAGRDLSKANLSGASLYGANLSGANLSGANLSDADLRGANLSKANLTMASLYRASLSGANLSGASLNEARLNEAGLGSADLRGADLTMASLYRANLREANLRGANLSDASLGGADLSKANLTMANLKGAFCNDWTVWPQGFDPIAAGAVKVD